jgi:hypothetical protein
MRVSLSIFNAVALSLYATAVSAQNETAPTNGTLATEPEEETTTDNNSTAGSGGTLAPRLPIDADFFGFNTTGPPYDLCDVADYYSELLAKSTNPLDWVMDEVALHVEATHRNQALPNVANVRGDGTFLFDSFLSHRIVSYLAMT